MGACIFLGVSEQESHWETDVVSALISEDGNKSVIFDILEGFILKQGSRLFFSIKKFIPWGI